MFSRTKHKGKKHYCMPCLQGFTTEKIVFNHKKQCLLVNGYQAVNNIISIRNNKICNL